MGEKTEVELERAKMRNYILEKENEIRVVGFVPYTTLYSSFNESSINKNYVFKYKKSVNLLFLDFYYWNRT